MAGLLLFTLETSGNNSQIPHVTSISNLTGYGPVSTNTLYQNIVTALQYVQTVTSYTCFFLNILKMAVFAQKSMRNNASGKFMLTISCLQFTWLFFRVFDHFAKRVITDFEKLYTYSMFLLYVMTFPSIIMYRSCLFIACLVSLERLYAVSRPMHVKQFIIARHPLLFIAATFLLTACYHIYVPFEYVYYTKPGINGSKTVVLGFTDWYFRNRDIFDGISATGKIIFVFVPLVWLTFFNALVVFLLRRHSDNRKAIKNTSDEDSASRRDRQMTMTIVACTAGYVIFLLPGAIHFLAVAVVPEYNYSGNLENLVSVMEKAQDICLQLSFMSDFLSFLLLSKAFRVCLRRFFMWRNFCAYVRHERIQYPTVKPGRFSESSA